MITFSNVTKKYGSANALDTMSLELNDNGIYCLLGQNGAGKTTLMKLLAGHIKATEGTITVDGKKVTPSHMPRCVNFVENNSDHFNLPIRTLIDVAAELQDDFDRDFAKEMVKRFKLNQTKKYKQLSLGMKTMLTTILSLANNSKVILLDEPVLGFDALMREQFNVLLSESIAAHPRIIIVSTHLIDEIAKVCNKLIILNEGKLLLKTDMENIDECAYTLTGPTAKVIPLIQNLNCIGKTTIGSMTAAHIYGNRITPPVGVTLDRITLQDFFINLVGGNENV